MKQLLPTPIQSFSRGFFAPFTALKMILKSPRMLLLVAVPLAVNIALYILFFKYGSDWIAVQIAATTGRLATVLPHWALTISTWALKILGWLLLGLAAALSFTLVSGLVSAPFNDSLSRAAVNTRIFPKKSAVLSHGIGTTLWLEFKRIIVLVVGGICAFTIGIIPFLQIPALLLGASLVAFEYFGYPISQRSHKLTSVAAFMARYPFVSLGFGSFLLLMMALPFTSIIYIPLAVVGGSILYADLTIK